MPSSSSVLSICRTVIAAGGKILWRVRPGKLQQNAHVERLNRMVRREWLGRYIFAMVKDVQQIATKWLWAYSTDHLSMGLAASQPP